uniref:Transcriptional adapter 2-beta n=1 Tax=Schistosoma haematobium TaxID=6185 RepID=A0A095A3W4_SCHHA
MVMATGKCLVNHSYYLRDEISAQLQSHSSTDCRDHYDKFYMSGIMKELMCSPCPFPLVKEHTYPNKLFDSEVENNPPCDLRLDHQKSLGYLPYRDEFEIEYMNSAEEVLNSVYTTSNCNKLDKGK